MHHVVSHCSFLKHQLKTDALEKKKKVCAITPTMLLYELGERGEIYLKVNRLQYLWVYCMCLV